MKQFYYQKQNTFNLDLSRIKYTIKIKKRHTVSTSTLELSYCTWKITSQDEKRKISRHNSYLKAGQATETKMSTNWIRNTIPETKHVFRK